MSERITFKYHPNVYENEIITHEKGICQCCGKEVDEYCNSMYSREEVDCICLECVANGAAAEKFDGQFIQDAEIDKVNDEKKSHELFCCTPGYVSWQGENWLACCGDYCAFLGDVGTNELEEMGIADEVFEEYLQRPFSVKEVREFLFKGGHLAGYLFRCLHCGRYYIEVDGD